MKTIFCAMCLLFATAAFAQNRASVGVDAQPQITEFASHVQKAVPKAMAREESLLEKNDTVYAKGERPLWEVAQQQPYATPLGDIARNLKKEHDTAKKSDTIWEN